MRVKGIIFDFDGTLFDSMSIWETAGKDYLASLGITAKEDLRKALKTKSLLQSAEYLNEHYSLNKTTEDVMAGINKTVEDFYFYRAMPKAYAVAALEGFLERGIKMCIATATDRYQVEAALKRCDMLKFFDYIFTCTELGHGKDEPHIFDFACASMGLAKSEVAVFEDAYHAAYTAKYAGYFVVGVYDRYEKKGKELENIADVYVNGFSETDKLFHI